MAKTSLEIWGNAFPTAEQVGKAYIAEILLMPDLDFWAIFGQRSLHELGMMLTFCAQRGWPVSVSNLPGWKFRTVVQVGDSLVMANETNCPELVFLLAQAIIEEKHRLTP